MQPYIPSQDGSLDTWASTFATTITSDPSVYGLQAADAVAITAAQVAYHAAYLIGGLDGSRHPVNPATRTIVTVAAKDAAKDVLRPILQSYSQIIQANPSVSNDAKSAIGLTIRQRGLPNTIPAPSTTPILTLTQSEPLTHLLRWNDSDIGPTSIRKPAGAVACEIRVSASATVITDPSAITYRTTASKAPLQIGFNSGDAGKVAYYVARWITRRGLVGPFGPINTLGIAA